MQKKITNNGKKGGMLKGKPHYDKQGNSVGGIKAVVTDAGNKPVELEGGEVIINKEASKKYWRELSKINQSAGNGVAIGPPAGMVDEDPSEEYGDGGKIEFNANKLPNKWILSYAKKIKKNHPEIWKLGGNIFGNEAFNNLSRVAERGYWLDSEEWMYKKWQSYVARHHKDYRIEGVVAMLKWVDKVDKGWPYMKQLIEDKIEKLSKKGKGWKHKSETKMKDGGTTRSSRWRPDFIKQLKPVNLDKYHLGGRTISQTPAPASDRIKGSKVNLKGTASTSSKASTIKFSNKVLSSIQSLIDEHNKKYPSKKITLEVAKAVVRRGMGAYSSSHRPTISGGQPNDRTAWGLARLKAFIYKAQKGKSKSGKFSQDNDLFEELDILVDKYHLGGDMSKHLAPNGKPSNLTSEQYKLVRTPEFKAWFGDWENEPENSSKVVDENGEPKVMYHGSRAEFNIFSDENENKLDWTVGGKGFYFTSNYYDAKGYGDRVLNCFIKAIEPAMSDGKQHAYISEYDLNKLKSYGSDSIYFDGEILNTEGKWIKIPDELVVFNSNQIKLADGTNTTFDANNPDIRFDGGGEIVLKIDEEHQKIINDKNNLSFNILNEKSEKIGSISLLYREDLGGYQVYNASVIEKERGKGIGKEAYIKLREILGKPIISDSSRTEGAENLWKSLEKNNLGFYDKKIDKYKMFNDGGEIPTNDFIYYDDLNDDLEQKLYSTAQEYFVKHKTDDYWHFSMQYFNGNQVTFEIYSAFGGYWLNFQLKSNKPLLNTIKLVPIEKMKKGGRTIAQTPAPKKDRVYGSEINEEGSSKDIKSASSIKFSKSVVESLINKIDEHNKKYPKKKIDLATAKSVVRRGMGAYSSSHRPTISGGQPNDRTAWGLARLKAFIYKAQKGKSKSGKFSQDNDLFEELDILVDKYHLGGDMSKHLAPNGKPSNLTHEQWHFVRTPEFKKWFGDWENSPKTASKVVDENGEPLVVYHGSPYKFNEFKVGINQTSMQQGADMGYFFTPDKKIAEAFSNVYPHSYFIELQQIQDELNKQKEQEQKDFFNQITDEDIDEIKDFLSEYDLKKEAQDIGNRKFEAINNAIPYLGKRLLRNSKIDFLVRLSDFSDKLFEKYKLIEEQKTAKLQEHYNSLPGGNVYAVFLNIKKIKSFLGDDIGFGDLREAKIGALLQDKAVNGVLIKMADTGMGFADEYVVSNSNQIKLADGTNVTFDSNNPDIRYEQGGLIAPNGKKSNLTPEQYKLVRTPQFKSWFGDWENNPSKASKVIDENGEPLVVYRGDSAQSKKGSIFKTGFNRMGFVSKNRLPNAYFHYFVDNYDVAMGYAENQIEDHNDKVQYTGKGKKWDTKVTPYFLNIRNPIDVTPNNPLFPSYKEYTQILKHQFGEDYETEQGYSTGWKYGFGITSSALNKIFIDKLGKDYLNANQWYRVDDWAKQGFEKGHWDENVYSFFIEYDYSRDRSAILNNVYNSMKNQGVDGMVFLESTHWKDKGDFYGEYNKYSRGEIKNEPKFDYKRWVEKPKVFAALESNQIKLADGSNTTFDGSNPDIRFDEGGELAMGIKAEHEHSQTIGKFKKPGVSDLQVETAIAKDHLKEDPHYYSKLQKMEAKKYDGGGLIDANGVEFTVGDKGIYGRKKDTVQITAISVKLVYYYDILDITKKQKSAYIDQFVKGFQVVKNQPQTSQTNVTNVTSKSIDDKIAEQKFIFAPKKLIKNLPPYLKELALINQEKQRGKRDENTDIGSAFSYSETPEGGSFWSPVFLGLWTDSQILDVVGSKEKLFELPTQSTTPTVVKKPMLQNLRSVKVLSTDDLEGRYLINAATQTVYFIDKYYIDKYTTESERNYFAVTIDASPNENLIATKDVLKFTDDEIRQIMDQFSPDWVVTKKISGEATKETSQQEPQIETVEIEPIQQQKPVAPKPEKFNPNLDYAALFNGYLQNNTESYVDITSDLVKRQISVFKTIISQ